MRMLHCRDDMFSNQPSAVLFDQGGATDEQRGITNDPHRSLPVEVLDCFLREFECYCQEHE